MKTEVMYTVVTSIYDEDPNKHEKLTTKFQEGILSKKPLNSVHSLQIQDTCNDQF